MLEVITFSDATSWSTNVSYVTNVHSVNIQVTTLSSYHSFNVIGTETELHTIDPIRVNVMMAQSPEF